MNSILTLTLIGIGIGLFLGAYLTNTGLGVWKNVKTDGSTFDWALNAIGKLKIILCN